MLTVSLCVVLVVGLQSSHKPIVKTEIPYSRKRKVPFLRLFHRKTPFRFCFRFHIKNSTSTSVLQISVSVFIFPLRFHYSSRKAVCFHSIFIPNATLAVFSQFLHQSIPFFVMSKNLHKIQRAKGTELPARWFSSKELFLVSCINV